MKMILAGGGDAEQSNQIDAFFLEHLPKRKFLFIPHAIAPKLWTYERAFAWIQKPKAFEDVDIVMWKDLKGKTVDDLAVFDAIYLMGGNTFELLYQLKESAFISLMRTFLENGKIVYGISAGAYVLGKDIQDRIPAEDEDKNKIGLRDLSALNLLCGYNVHCHYLPEHNEQLLEFVKKYQTPLIAIPERSGVYVDGANCLSLGYEPVYLYQKGGERVVIEPNTQFFLTQ